MQSPNIAQYKALGIGAPTVRCGGYSQLVTLSKMRSYNDLGEEHLGKGAASESWAINGGQAGACGVDRVQEQVRLPGNSAHM